MYLISDIHKGSYLDVPGQFMSWKEQVLLMFCILSEYCSSGSLLEDLEAWFVGGVAFHYAFWPPMKWIVTPVNVLWCV